MPEIKRVLAAVCLTERSPSVLAFAVELSRRFEAKLIVLNVVNVRNVQEVSAVQSMGYDVDAEEYQKGFKAERREQLYELTKNSGLPQDRLKTVVRIGHPVEQILEVIEEKRADIVVIGDKGRTNLEMLLLGSVAEKVVRHSPVPVVSYRDRRKNRERRGHPMSE